MSEHPRLRGDLVVRRIRHRHETYVIVKDPVARTYFKFEPWEEDAIRLLDGTRTYAEAAAEFDALHPDRLADEQWMMDYVEGLRLTGLIERDERDKHLVMMDRLKELNKKKKRRLIDSSSTLFEIQFPLFDPDAAMNRVMPWIRWAWAPWFALSWVAVFCVVLGFLIRHWDLYWSGFFGLFDPSRNTAWDWIGLVALMVLAGIWHELGHGLSCKRFGGEVHDIGFTLFYFEPAFYCKVDDSYTFPRLSDRLWCVFGGPYFEFMLCSVAVAVWLLTPAEWRVHDVALTIVFISGISVLINFNPLLKLDGYYALMDWLGVPELRESSFRYLGSLLKRSLLRLDVPHEPLPRRRRRIYLVYGVTALLYTTLILLALGALARRLLVGWLGPLGYVILLAIVLLLLRRKIEQGVRFARWLWLDKREALLAGRPRWIAAGALAALLLLLTVPRTATRIEASFVVEPGERAVIRAATDGRVAEVAVVEGQRVEAGEIVARLESPDLAAQYERAAADLERGERLAAASRSRGDLADAAERGVEAAEAGARRQRLAERMERLALASPVTGVVSTPEVELARGRWLAEGDELCVVDRLETVGLAIAASEVDAREIAPGTPLRLMLTAYPTRTLRGTVRGVAPVAEPPSVDEEARLDLVQRVHVLRVRVEIGNEDGKLRPGMSGRVQFLTQPRSAAAKGWRGLSRWFSSVVW